MVWISMCKNSVYLVKKYHSVHILSTLDEHKNSTLVYIVSFINALCGFLNKVIHGLFGLHKGILSSFARFPHKLLLLLLPIKLNIINKTIKNRSFV